MIAVNEVELKFLDIDTNAMSGEAMRAICAKLCLDSDEGTGRTSFELWPELSG